jgi:hypothetical protein
VDICFEGSADVCCDVGVVGVGRLQRVLNLNARNKTVASTNMHVELLSANTHKLTFTLRKHVLHGDSCVDGEVLDTVVLSTVAKVGGSCYGNRVGTPCTYCFHTVAHKCSNANASIRHQPHEISIVPMDKID